jgi:hypothetical protein
MDEIREAFLHAVRACHQTSMCITISRFFNTHCYLQLLNAFMILD